jgi:DNA-binding response OmpR family regulator
MKILLVEDEKKLAGFVRRGLQEQGWQVELQQNGDEAYRRACTEAYDLIVLDIMLPGRDGLSILKNLREKRNPVPVILVTARSECNERIAGLEQGADDYITKPFYVEELVARIKAILRRTSDQPLNVLQAGELTVNLVTREVKAGAQAVELTQREFSLLEYLMRSPGRVFTRCQILEHVWGYDFDPQTNVVDVCVRRLRAKIDTGSDDSCIETVRGVGYRFRGLEPSS